DDLRHWEYLHPMLVGDLSATSPVNTGTMWECPDFFEMDGRGVLLLNAWGVGNHHAVAVTGEMDETGTRLRNGHYSHLDGGEFYAPQSMWDGNGRRVQWGWLREGRPSAAGTAAGWSGAMSLPRILRVTELRSNSNCGLITRLTVVQARGSGAVPMTRNGPLPATTRRLAASSLTGPPRASTRK
ncbi:MAG: hypothetical protein EBT22_09325, partial [Chloroflexi bacterium]|nr:hypothetical protein [Chloroflexota bacterium]